MSGHRFLRTLQTTEGWLRPQCECGEDFENYEEIRAHLDRAELAAIDARPDEAEDDGA